MSLTTALSIAQTSLFNTSRQTGVVSRNVSEAGNADYARRSSVLASSANGARVVDIRRAADEMLFRQNLGALSAWNGQNALLSGMQQLSFSVYGNDYASSPAKAIEQFQTALQLYSSTPSDRNVAESAIEAARQVVRSLNEGTTAIQAFRGDTDKQIATAVGDLNALLVRFDQANRTVVSGIRAGLDVNDALDQRDALLKKISEFVPVASITRGDNDMVLTTQNGITLYETSPREVSFVPTPGYVAGSTGNQIYVDGVPLAGGSGGNTSASGSLAAMLQLRDGVAVGMQAQLDEIARGLVLAFAESDPSGVGPDVPGLFTWAGAPAMPGMPETGLAASIRTNAAMDARAGGDPTLLRDGAAYDANPANNSSFSDLLHRYADNLTEPMAFDLAAGAGTQLSPAGYASATIGWFEGIRQQASQAEETKGALMVRTAEALSNSTAVNIDYEMSLLLDLEHSYEASAKLLAVIDEMLATLLASVR